MKACDTIDKASKGVLAGLAAAMMVGQWWVEQLPEGASGITRSPEGRDCYLIADDRGGRFWQAKIPLDEVTGLVDTNKVKVFAPRTVPGAVDIEAISFGGGELFLGDESGFRISSRKFPLAAGDSFARIPTPKPLADYVPNRGLESLAASEDGLTLWMCNECPLKCDRPANASAGLPLRLTRMTRASTSEQWAASGQFAYMADPLGGAPFRGHEVSGMADLCMMPDGTLLALERELSKKGSLPSFRIRVYRVDANGATDVSDFGSLSAPDAEYAAVGKTLVHQISGPMSLANYEGMCAGPKLRDGSQTIILISDGGQNAPRMLAVLRLL